MANTVASSWRSHSVLPGFHIGLGITLLYLSLIVLIPLAAVFVTTTQLTWARFAEIAFSAQALATYKLTFGTAFGAALLNAVFGLLVAWVLVRYDFPLRRLVDAMVDLPFALPTAVAGIALTALYASNGWIGQFLPFKVSYTPLGVLVAMTFIGLPFVVRTIQPVLEDWHHEQEEAAAMLGASRWQTFSHVIFPALVPALLTGFALALARALAPQAHGTQRDGYGAHGQPNGIPPLRHANAGGGFLEAVVVPHHAHAQYSDHGEQQCHQGGT